jgi:hypothetical protein
VNSDQGFNVDFIRPGNWIVRKADWNIFRKVFNFKYDANRDATHNVEILTRCVIEAANCSVPRSSGNVPRPAVPWWNKECAEAIRLRKRALRILKKYPTTMNLSSSSTASESSTSREGGKEGLLDGIRQ